MYKLKFSIKYLFYLLIKNPVKVGLMIAFGIVLNIVINAEDEPVKYEVVGQVEHNNNIIYTVKQNSLDDDGNMKYSSRSYVGKEEPAKIDSGGYITEMEVKSSTGWMIFGLVIIAFAWGFITFSDEEDVNWNFSKIYKDLLIREVKRHNDTKEIYYVYRNKVLYVQPYVGELYNAPKFGGYRIIELIEKCKATPQLYDDYKGTKSQIRDKKIDSVVGR